MNYSEQYNKLIESRRYRVLSKNVCYEKHHIIMRSMSGTDDDNNLIYLTPREHFVAHRLLWLIHRNKSAAFAFRMMCSRNKTWSSRFYEETRTHLKHSDDTKRKISKSRKGIIFSDEHRKKLSDAKNGIFTGIQWKGGNTYWKNKTGAFNGKTHSEESRMRMSEAKKGRIPWNKGKQASEESRKKMSEAKKGKRSSFKGKHHSEESKRKNREAHIGQIPWNKK